jgi:ABC-type glycerol-3-phosphate transport system permease component
MSGRRLLIYGFATLLVIWTLVPIYWLFNMSLMFKTELLSVPTHLYPHDPTVSNYTRLFGGTAIGPGGAELAVIGQAPIIQQGLRNSLVVAVIVTILTMIISLPVAYALGRLQFRGRTAMLFAIITSRSYPPIAIVLPFVLLYSQVGLQGTVRGLVIIYLTLTIPMIIWVMTSFFSSLPRTVEAAARVDGNTRWQAFYRVILPMSWFAGTNSFFLSFSLLAQGHRHCRQPSRRSFSRYRSRPRWPRYLSSRLFHRHSLPICSKAESAVSILSIPCSGAECKNCSESLSAARSGARTE